MLNMELAKAVYEDYKASLRKEDEVKLLLKDLRIAAIAAEDADEKLKLYETIEEFEYKLDSIRRSSDVLARLIVKYTFE